MPGSTSESGPNLTNNEIVLQNDINEIIFVCAIVYHRPLILSLTIDIMPRFTRNLSAVKHFWMSSLGDFCADKPTWSFQKDLLLTIIAIKSKCIMETVQNWIKFSAILLIIPFMFLWLLPSAYMVKHYDEWHRCAQLINSSTRWVLWNRFNWKSNAYIYGKNVTKTKFQFYF